MSFFIVVGGSFPLISKDSIMSKDVSSIYTFLGEYLRSVLGSITVEFLKTLPNLSDKYSLYPPTITRPLFALSYLLVIEVL